MCLISMVSPLFPNCPLCAPRDSFRSNAFAQAKYIPPLFTRWTGHDYFNSNLPPPKIQRWSCKAGYRNSLKKGRKNSCPSVEFISRELGHTRGAVFWEGVGGIFVPHSPPPSPGPPVAVHLRLLGSGRLPRGRREPPLWGHSVRCDEGRRGVRFLRGGLGGGVVFLVGCGFEKLLFENNKFRNNMFSKAHTFLIPKVRTESLYILGFWV